MPKMKAAMAAVLWFGMAGEVRWLSYGFTERGLHLTALVVFGGAGGLHACALAESLGTPVVLAPAQAGVLSALGALTGGSRRERSRTVESVIRQYLNTFPICFITAL